MLKKRWLETIKKNHRRKKKAIEDNLLLRSMKTDRTAQYTTRDTVSERIKENKSAQKETMMSKEKEKGEDVVPVTKQSGSSNESSEQESKGENTMRSIFTAFT